MKIKKVTAFAMSTVITLTTIMPGVSYETETIIENVKDTNVDEIDAKENIDVSKKHEIHFNIKNDYGAFVKNSYDNSGTYLVTRAVDGGKKAGKVPTIKLNKGYVFMGWTDQEGAIYTSNTDIENLPVDKDYTFNVYAKKITGNLLEEFKDVKLRKAIVDKLDYNRQKPQDVIIPEGYEYPLFTTDMDAIKTIDSIHISSIVMGEENQLVTSLDGIEKLESVKKLTIYRGDLGDVDLSKLENLEELTIEDANVTSLKLPKPYYGKGLRTIKLSGNKIESLDLKGLKFLEEVDINEKKLKKIDTEDLIRLEDLRIRNAKNLNTLDTYDLRPIKELRLDNCGFTEFDS